MVYEKNERFTMEQHIDTPSILNFGIFIRIIFGHLN